VSRSLNKEIISTSCILLIILLSQAFYGSILNAEAKIKTNRKIIVIDPGHGGDDLGITVNSDLYEKTCTLKLAKLTAKLLKDKYTVLLTRENDIHLPVLKRTSFANIKKADIFISLHAKKGTNSNSFIILKSFAGKKQLKPESLIPWKSEQLKFLEKSRRAAKILAANFKKKFQTDFHIIDAPAIVLQGARMPAVLIETLSMEELMGETDNDQIIQNHARAIAKSLEKILN
jgi:N-acetylmuramoyl-L-alanine amidase